MSTSDESGKCEEVEHVAVPPEWAARPGDERVLVAVWAPPGRRGWIEQALAGIASDTRFTDSPQELGEAEADLAIVSHALLAGEKLPLGATALRVVIDTPEQARVAWLERGADLAAGPDASASELAAQIRALLRRAEAERDRSPLTGLPGNRRLRRYLRAKLAENETVALVMADIDDFKAYNDARGHLAGDALIALLAEVLREATESNEAFLAHVGGDDFAVVCRPGASDGIARRAEVEFARRCEHATVTVVGTKLQPREGEALQEAFRRLAALRAARRAEG